MTTDDGTDEPAAGPRDQLREEAASWFARMRGDDADQHRAAFEAWLARGAVHRAAYNRIGEIFAAGKALKDPLAPVSSAPTPKAFRATIVAFLSLAVILVSGTIGWHVLRPYAVQSRSNELPLAAATTNVGSGRMQARTLREGVVTLADTDGEISWPVAGDATLARLERGRARFVVSSPAGAQHILAGPVEAVSSDGSFDMWIRADGSLDVNVLKGRVGLRPTVGTDKGPRRPIRAVLWFEAGRRYSVAADGTGRLVATGAGPDWPHGTLEYRRTSLAEVIEEANRYSSTKIVLADPALGRRLVSGRFRKDDTSVLAERLADALGLAAVKPKPGYIELRAFD